MDPASLTREQPKRMFQREIMRSQKFNRSSIDVKRQADTAVKETATEARRDSAERRREQAPKKRSFQ